MKDRNISLLVVVVFFSLALIGFWFAINAKMSLNAMRFKTALKKVVESVPVKSVVPAKAINVTDKNGNIISKYILVPELVSTGKYTKAGEKNIALYTLGYAKLNLEKKVLKPEVISGE